MAAPIIDPRRREAFQRALFGDDVTALTAADRKDARDALHLLEALATTGDSIASTEPLVARTKAARSAIDDALERALDVSRRIYETLEENVKGHARAAAALATLPATRRPKELRRLVTDARKVLRAAKK